MSKGTIETYKKHANWICGAPGYWGGEGSSGINVESNYSYSGQPSFDWMPKATKGGDATVHKYALFTANAGLQKGRGSSFFPMWSSNHEFFPGPSGEGARYYTCRGGNGGNGIGGGGGGGASPSDHAKPRDAGESGYNVPNYWKSWDGHLEPGHPNYYTVWELISHDGATQDPAISEAGWPKYNGSAGRAGDPHILVKVTNSYSTAGLQRDTTDTAQILDNDSREVVVAIQKGIWKQSNGSIAKHEYTVAGAFSTGDTLDFGGETWTYTVEDAQQFWLPLQGGTSKINSPTELDYGRRYVRTSKITAKKMTALRRWTKLASNGFRFYFYTIEVFDANTSVAANSSTASDTSPGGESGWTSDNTVYWGYPSSAVYRIPSTNTGYVKN